MSATPWYKRGRANPRYLTENRDYPADYADDANKIPVVKTTEDGLEFLTIASGAGIQVEFDRASGRLIFRLASEQSAPAADAGSAAFSGAAPTLALTAHQIPLPSVGAAALTGAAPELVVA